MNIKLLRLQTGEDLIGDVITQSDTEVAIENPCMVYVRPNNTGSSASIGLTRWMP